MTTERAGLVTRYLPATNHRGSRIKVRWNKDTYTASYDHAARNPFTSAAREALEHWGYTVDAVEFVTDHGRDTIYTAEVTKDTATA